MADPLFLAVVSVLIAHELDAIRRAEWRFFFAPVDVRDETAYRVFVALHVPALVGVLWLLDVRSFQVGLDVFAVAHAGVHFALRDHPRVDFDDPFSWGWILGAAVLGAGHLLVVL